MWCSYVIQWLLCNSSVHFTTDQEMYFNAEENVAEIIHNLAVALCSYSWSECLDYQTKGVRDYLFLANQNFCIRILAFYFPWGSHTTEKTTDFWHNYINIHESRTYEYQWQNMGSLTSNPNSIKTLAIVLIMTKIIICLLAFNSNNNCTTTIYFLMP